MSCLLHNHPPHFFHLRATLVGSWTFVSHTVLIQVAKGQLTSEGAEIKILFVSNSPCSDEFQPPQRAPAKFISKYRAREQHVALSEFELLPNIGCSVQYFLQYTVKCNLSCVIHLKEIVLTILPPPPAFLPGLLDDLLICRAGENAWLAFSSRVGGHPLHIYLCHWENSGGTCSWSFLKDVYCLAL